MEFNEELFFELKDKKRNGIATPEELATLIEMKNSPGNLARKQAIDERLAKRHHNTKLIITGLVIAFVVYKIFKIERELNKRGNRI